MRSEHRINRINDEVEHAIERAITVARILDQTAGMGRGGARSGEKRARLRQRQRRADMGDIDRDLARADRSSVAPRRALQVLAGQFQDFADLSENDVPYCCTATRGATFGMLGRNKTW